MVANTQLQHPAKASSEQNQMSTEMQQCIEECLNCQSICLATVQYALKIGGKLADSELISALLDCEDICQTSANFMIRGSHLHKHTCAAAAEVAQRCAELCGQFSDDPQLRACAEACAKCAESCQEMAR